jgi:hypothetical protein
VSECECECVSVCVYRVELNIITTSTRKLLESRLDVPLQEKALMRSTRPAMALKDWNVRGACAIEGGFQSARKKQ